MIFYVLKWHQDQRSNSATVTRYSFQLGTELKKIMEEGKLVSDDVTLGLLARAMAVGGKTNR